MPGLSFYQTEPLLGSTLPPATLDLFFLLVIPCVKFWVVLSLSSLNRELNYQPIYVWFEIHDID